MKIANICSKIITFCFYLLFFLVPIIFTGDTSELFELNKMWLTWGLTIVIGAAWLTKMIFAKQFRIQRTPLDIPILLFLLSQVIATIFSLDSYVSWWGYYSRFNGGLLSLITYIFLYYALVSNSTPKHVFRFIQVILLSGLFVTLWGLPAHFGYDPTCFVFRGTFDVSCWTFAFQPKVRIFSTLGQPDWMAAFLVALIPISIAYGINYFKKGKAFGSIYFLVLTTLFYLGLLYTRAKSGFVGIAVGVIIFYICDLWLRRKEFRKITLNKLITKHWYCSTIIIILLIATFIIGTPFTQFDKFTLSGLQGLLTRHQSTQVQSPAKQAAAIGGGGEIGGTDSGKIRLLVWHGALDVWKHYPLFGSGVETFAYAYYLYRPAAHNMTSEWDYLYNKAHNEYLNYLATTGTFGFLTVLFMMVWFVYQFLRQFKVQNEKFKIKIQNLKSDKEQFVLAQSYSNLNTLNFAILASYISIIVTNFFGFSVVIMNIFFFLFPAFIFMLNNMLKAESAIALPKQSNPSNEFNPLQYMAGGIFVLSAVFLIMILIRDRDADIAYALGNNYDKAGYFQTATQYLRKAVDLRGEEPVFKDELSVNDTAMALAFAQQKDATSASKLAQEAVSMNSEITTNHPNNLIYWKSRVKIFYSLGSLDVKYLPFALQAIQKAHELAPTDAKVSYNLGILYGQTNHVDQAISTLQDTIKLKPDYRDAYYALALMYREAALNGQASVQKPDMEIKAIDTMHFILDNFNKDDADVKKTLKSWGEE